MKFLLDHDVPDDLSYLLEELAHEVRLLRKVLPEDASDESVLQFAHDSDCVLLTCNRDDFLQLAKHKPHHGIIIVIRRRTRAAERAARARELPAPIQMCDALPRNLPRELEVILANCLTHGRRYFVEATANFPEECRYILEILGKVCHNDAVARDQAMTPDQRLKYHQIESGPLTDEIKRWLDKQVDEKLCEPNSDLGSAVAYMRNHWQPLTQFLRVPGAPLDSSIVERALKKSILHRKNSLFYKTQRGARVGDLFMSLIYTCQLLDVNPFDYLAALLRNPDWLAREPAEWMPWNYYDTLASLVPASAAN